MAERRRGERCGTRDHERARADWTSISHTARANRDRAAHLLARVAEVQARVDEADAVAHGTARYRQARFAELLGDDPCTAWSLAAESVRQCRVSLRPTLARLGAGLAQGLRPPALAGGGGPKPLPRSRLPEL